MFKVNKNVWVKLMKSKIYFSKPELGSNFTIKSVSDFDYACKSDFEYDFSSAFMNLDISNFFTLYFHSSK